MNSTLGYSLVLLGLACAAFAAVVGIVSGLMRREGALPWVQRGHVRLRRLDDRRRTW